MLYVNHGVKVESFVAADLTFLCVKLKACLVESGCAAIVDMWSLHVYYKKLVRDIMFAIQVESERPCSLTSVPVCLFPMQTPHNYACCPTT